jgi:glutamine amidotransferase
MARLSDVDVDIDFASETTERDVVTVVATMPLTCNENWQAMAAGEAMMFKAGALVRRF